MIGRYPRATAADRAADEARRLGLSQPARLTTAGNVLGCGREVVSVERFRILFDVHTHEAATPDQVDGWAFAVLDELVAT
jgi:hypothetical protein